LGAAGILLPLVLLLLLGFSLLGRGQNFTLQAADEAQLRSLAETGLDLFMPIILDGGTADSAEGVVFRDYNANGARDAREPGVPGIIVSAYNDSGFKAGSTITGADGQYALYLPANKEYRLEFTSIPDYLQPGAVGKATDATVAFITAPSSNVDVGLNNPADYCQQNPELGSACYIFGDQRQELPALVSFHNRAGSTALDDTFTPPGESPYDDANNAVPGIQPHPIEAYTQEIGPTNGLAFQRSANVLFAGAFMKRHTGFGPDGTGAIYRIDRSANKVTVYADLNAIFGANTAGADPHDSSGMSDVSQILNFYFHDPSFDEVSKISLGDVEITEDEKHLYTVNLADRMLYRIPVRNEASPGFSSGDIDRFTMPTLPGCALADTRPFALGIQDGVLYAGIVCTAQSTQQAGDMHAYVYSFDGSNFNPQPVLDFPLNYTRACADRVPGAPECGVQQGNSDADWNPWVGEFGQLLAKSDTDTSSNQGRRWTIYPQPLLTDIEFANGYMIIGLRDRNGDLIGNGAGDPRRANGDPIGFPPAMSGPNNQYLTVGAGDILSAAPDPDRPGRWKLENNASVGNLPPTDGANNGNGPGNGEYFFDESFAVVNDNRPRHSEVAQGGLTNIPGQGDALTTAFNPVPIEDEANYFDGGIIWLSAQDGTRSRSYRVFAGDPPPSLPLGPIDETAFLQGKNNGLGDLEVFCDPAPLEIGDRVWFDADKNGIQDPGEQPLAGVSVKLYAPDMTTLLATAVTDAGGNYYFSNASSGPLSGDFAVYGVDLQPNTTGYKLRIDLSQPAIADNNYVLTKPNADGHTDNNNKTDLRDSDAITSGQNAEIMFDTTGPGHNNHTLDFGFVAHVAVGNRVWLDDGKGDGGVADDGIVNGDEMGIGEVEVQLYPGTGVSGTPLKTTTTRAEAGAEGCYLFDDLQPGDYIIHIPASQFAEGSALHNLTSSSPQGGDTPDDDNVDENGQNTPVNGGISSTVINLTVGAEPTNEPSRSLCASSQPDANENMTVDFGFTTPVPGIGIIKYTNGQDANRPILPGVPQIPIGQPVTWTYEVTNSGNVPFAKEDVVVMDSRGVVPVFDSVIHGNDDDTLDPGEIWLYKATGTAADVGLPEPDPVPTLWGVDEQQNAIFSVDDYNKIGSGAAAAGLTIYGPLRYTNLDGVTQDVGKHIGSFSIDNDNVAYMAYNKNLDPGGGLPLLKAPVLMKFDLDNVQPVGDNTVQVIGSIPIPGFDITASVDDNISGMSFDPTTGKLYALYRVTDGPAPDKLLLVSKVDASLIADLGEMRNDTLGVITEDGEALEFDRNGNLYVSDNWTDRLYLVDQQTAQVISVVDNNQLGGLTGIGLSLKTEGLAWDPLSDTMAATDDTNDLFYIQTLENGNNVSLGSLPGLLDVEAIDFLISCYMNVGKVTATVTVGDVSASVSDTDPSHYCN
jgi:hypothetical protein